MINIIDINKYQNGLSTFNITNKIKFINNEYL